MKIRTNKFIGGLIVGMVLLASAANAAVVTVSMNPANVPANPILDSGGANLAAGYVQVIKSTDSSISLPNSNTGLPSDASDKVVGTPGNLSAAGTYIKSGFSIPNNNYVYLVAWDTWNGVGVPSGNYGVSAISQSMSGISYTFKPASFKTDKQINGPSISCSPTKADPDSQNVIITITGSKTNFDDQVGHTSVVSFTPATGITINSTQIDKVAQKIVISATFVAAQSGARSLKVTTGAEIVSTTFTVNQVVVPVASLVSATKNVGSQGETLASVDIVGLSTHFNSNSVVDFGAGITHGAIDAKDATHITVANVVIDANAAIGSRNVSVTTNYQGKPEFATGDIFSVKAGGVVTSVILDDFEGIYVDLASYYGFQSKAQYAPTFPRISSDKYEGGYSKQTTYPEIADPANAWRGWGGIEKTVKDISQLEQISFWMKGDGSTNTVKIQLKDKDGDNYTVADSDTADIIPLSNTSWTKYSIPISKLTNRIAGGSDPGSNSVLDLTQIAQYQFVFTGTAASNGVLIDYVVAEMASVPSDDPAIVSIDPTSGPVGTVVNINGSKFGTSGTVQIFKNQVLETSIQSSGIPDASGNVWGASTITIKIPDTLTPGAKTIKVVRADAKSSIAVTFTVTTTAAGASSYNYPNPFNPRVETTNIVFDPAGNTAASAYIFDSTAKVVQKINWTSGGANEVTWNGRNSYSELLGDGVYPYRVVDANNKVLGKGKILVINK